jgi:hypothetical protein
MHSHGEVVRSAWFDTVHFPGYYAFNLTKLDWSQILVFPMTPYTLLRTLLQ